MFPAKLGAPSSNLIIFKRLQIHIYMNWQFIIITKKNVSNYRKKATRSICYLLLFFATILISYLPIRD